MRTMILRAGLAAAFGLTGLSSAGAQEKPGAPARPPEGRAAEIRQLEAVLAQMKARVTELESKSGAKPALGSPAASEGETQEIRRLRILQEWCLAQERQLALQVKEGQRNPTDAKAPPATETPRPLVPAAEQQKLLQQALDRLQWQIAEHKARLPGGGAAQSAQVPSKSKPEGMQFRLVLGEENEKGAGEGAQAALKALTQNRDPVVAFLAQALFQRLGGQAKPGAGPLGWGQLAPGASLPSGGITYKFEGGTAYTPKPGQPGAQINAKPTAEGAKSGGGQIIVISEGEGLKVERPKNPGEPARRSGGFDIQPVPNPFGAPHPGKKDSLGGFKLEPGSNPFGASKPPALGTSPWGKSTGEKGGEAVPTRETAHAVGHGSLLMSPDKKHAVVFGADGSISVYETTSGLEIMRLGSARK